MRRRREAPSCHAAPRMNSPSLGHVCSFSEVISHRLSCEKYCPQNTLLKLRKMAVHTSSTCKKMLPDVASNVNLNDHLHVRNPTFVMENHEITIMCEGSQMVFMFPYTCLRPRSVQENSNLRQSFFPLTQCLKEQLPTPQKFYTWRFLRATLTASSTAQAETEMVPTNPMVRPCFTCCCKFFRTKALGLAPVTEMAPRCMFCPSPLCATSCFSRRSIARPKLWYFSQHPRSLSHSTTCPWNTLGTVPHLLSQSSHQSKRSEVPPHVCFFQHAPILRLLLHFRLRVLLDT